MGAIPRRPKPNHVFLNVPFDAGYERLAVAEVAAIVALGRTPRCVLEIPEHGQGRLSRLVGIILECGLSIHDLSRVGTPVRFNMPFELGIACGAAELTGQHKFIVFERIRHRVNRTLSDMNRCDPYIHGGTVGGVLSCVMDGLGTLAGDPPIEKVRLLDTRLWAFARGRKIAHRSDLIFTRAIFRDIADHAVDMAVELGLLV